MNKKLEIFENQLSLIKDKDIKTLVELCLIAAPQYFWTIPASSSGLRHPDYQQVEGGLVIHTKMVVNWACRLMEMEEYNYFQYRRDIVIAACICHDLVKRGFEQQQKTVPQHPTLAKNLILDIANKNDLVISNINSICSCVESHMGSWNKDKEGKEILPKPITQLQKLVHLADYCAAQKFNVPEQQLL